MSLSALRELRLYFWAKLIRELSRQFSGLASTAYCLKLSKDANDRLEKPEWLLTVDCWLLTVEGGVEKLNGWVLTVDSILLLWCTRKRYKEISSFEEVVPTAENIAVRIGQLLLAPVWDLASELHKIKLIESPNNSCEIYGADLEEVTTQRQQPEAVLAGV